MSESAIWAEVARRGIGKSKFDYGSWEWERLRKFALWRANYTCESPACDIHGPENLHVHHRIPLSVDMTKAFDPENLVVHCFLHHALAHRMRKIPKRWLRYQPANDAQFSLPLEDTG